MIKKFLQKVFSKKIEGEVAINQAASIQFWSNSASQHASAVVEQLWGMPADVALIDTV